MLDLLSLEMPLPDLSLDLLSVLAFGALSSESFFKPGFLNIEEILQEHKSIHVRKKTTNTVLKTIPKFIDMSLSLKKSTGCIYHHENRVRIISTDCFNIVFAHPLYGYIFDILLQKRAYSHTRWQIAG